MITAANRQTLLNNLTLSTTLKNSLQAKLTASDLAGFDQQLLDYTRTRTNVNFFFDPDDAATLGSYITTNIGDGGAVARADDILAHRFPQQSDAQTYTVQLPTDIDWDNKEWATWAGDRAAHERAR